MARFANLAALLTGGTAPAAGTPDDDDADTGVDIAAINGAVSKDVDAAVTKATAAANDRWNAVMTSDAGRRNPAAAARICSKTAMSAEDVIATLGDMGGTKDDDEEQDDAPDKGRKDVAGTNRDRLRGNDGQRDRRDAGKPGGNDLNRDTGGARGNGGGADGGFDAAAHRRKTAEKRNASVERQAGGKDRARRAGE